VHFAVFLFVRALIDLSRSKASSLAVQPATGCCLIPLCPTPFRRAPLSDFRALQHHRTHRLLPRGSILEYRPRPRFLTVMAAILPANPFQAYFILEALLGFPFRGFFSNAGSIAFATNFPSCRSRWPLTSRAVLGIQQEAWVDFRVLPNIRARSHCRSALAHPTRPIPSWALSSLGFFRLKKMGSLRLHLSCVFAFELPKVSAGTRYRVYFFLSGQRLSRGVIPLSRFPATKCLLTFYGEKPPVWRWLVV